MKGCLPSSVLTAAPPRKRPDEEMVLVRTGGPDERIIGKLFELERVDDGCPDEWRMNLTDSKPLEPPKLDLTTLL